MGDKQNAEQVVWEAPSGVQMSLIPEPGGSLLVEVKDGMVILTGKHCRHSQGEHASKPTDVAHQILAEVHLTIVSCRCQITWRSVVATKGSGVK